MLTEISIRDLGVIPDATLEFSPGLTVLTGETGAGKTMVVTSLKLLCGARADAGRVRTGADKALVEGRVSTEHLSEEESATIDAVVSELGGERDENDEYLLARQVSAKGRSRAWVGGRSASAAALADVSTRLIAIHGQNDQLRLQSADEQRAAIDRMDAETIVPTLETYRQQRAHWRTMVKELEEKTSKRRELAMRADQLSFAIEEIDAVSPEPDEDQDLASQIRRMQDLDGLRDAAAVALAAIDGAAAVGATGMDAATEDSGAAELLGAAANELAGANDDELTEFSNQLNELTSQLSEISAGLGAFLSGLPEETESLDKLMQRQVEIKNLTRKYAPDIAGVLAWRDKAERKLATLDVSGEALDKLTAEIKTAEKKLGTTARKLSKARAKAAKHLEEAVTKELKGLAMPHTSLVVEITKADTFGPAGVDNIEFKLRAHEGAEPRPLASSASGGELSRIMLALEVVLAEGQAGHTMVFDEVDAGVGGRAAVEIGKRLKQLAVNNQVIVVTHLPQVAAFADTHLVVSKDARSGAVSSKVTSLGDEERIDELARMMAGLDDSDSGRAHAQDLLDQARRAFAAK
ncbi:DNA repair protein RecN [Corynebacterium amycolatum]|uniref:DNA repair protein RecN n=1 Tax=Corynebacterium amycolatum TaxID=43765 RepID=UPI00254AA286|nr:DNA repair protein RecN [Corynebacterium amycolatum]MDK7200407.1 DNA repair protein RecN [Corynebacterium amycolatum]